MSPRLRMCPALNVAPRDGKKLQQDISEACDVVVIGGGPAGTTIATRLVQMGWQVSLLEKERHPRFHIGESLLPMNLPILEQLGVLEQVKVIGLTKYGAEFNSTVDDRPSQTYYFSEALDKAHPHAFQVRRSEFDELLFRNCIARGVRAREGTRVTDVDFHPGGRSVVRAVTEAGEPLSLECAYVVDASGRDTFLSRRLGSRRKSKEHNSAAIFGHYGSAPRRPGRDAGNISIYWFEHGWFWMIPLRDGTMSVGAVCWPEYLGTRDVSTEEFFARTIALCQPVAERMQDAQLLGPVRATGNFSYRSTRMFGPGYLLVGDAYTFIDPVFSSGVFLAMHAAMEGSIVLDACMRDPATAAARLKAHEERVLRGVRVISWFIYRFTSPALHRMFMKPANHFRVKEAVISMLAGDVYRDTPLKRPMLAFKLFYYLMSAQHLFRSWAGHLRRRRNVRVTFSGGTTPVDLDT